MMQLYDGLYIHRQTLVVFMPSALVITPDEIERSQLCAAFEAMLFEARGTSAAQLLTLQKPPEAASILTISYEGEGYGLPLVARLRNGYGAFGPGPAIILVADKNCPALERAAREFGLYGIVLRPVTAAKLARIVEAVLVEGPVRNSGRPQRAAAQ